MPFLGSALGYLTAMCSPGWGNLFAIDWNDLPVGSKFDPASRPLPSSVHTTHLDLTCVHVAWRLGMTIVCAVVVVIIIIIIIFTSTAVSRVMSVFPGKFQIFENLGALPLPVHAPARTPLVLNQWLAWCSLFFLFVVLFFWGGSSFVWDGPFNGRWC